MITVTGLGGEEIESGGDVVTVSPGGEELLEVLGESVGSMIMLLPAATASGFDTVDPELFDHVMVSPDVLALTEGLGVVLGGGVLVVIGGGVPVVVPVVVLGGDGVPLECTITFLATQRTCGESC